MSNTSNNLSNEELLATNAALKAQVDYLAKQVAELTKLKMNMVNTPEESDEEEEVPLEDNSSNTARGENYERGKDVPEEKKELYKDDEDFKEMYAQCLSRPHGDYLIKDGNLFRGNQLCIPRSSVRETLIDESYTARSQIAQKNLRNA
ncbi:unnamed protein product [Cuscuta campestris]|uniref:Uncharacterized protein n=1 Tax=Cuscuta campestris TaxID=132261 RepID=A0A484LTT0_9ASTE|nr:unnamed protein product [Cuscuta campestris]